MPTNMLVEQALEFVATSDERDATQQHNFQLNKLCASHRV